MIIINESKYGHVINKYTYSLKSIVVVCLWLSFECIIIWLKCSLFYHKTKFILLIHIFSLFRILLKHLSFGRIEFKFLKAEF